MVHLHFRELLDIALRSLNSYLFRNPKWWIQVGRCIISFFSTRELDIFDITEYMFFEACKIITMDLRRQRSIAIYKPIHFLESEVVAVAKYKFKMDETQWRTIKATSNKFTSKFQFCDIFARRLYFRLGNYAFKPVF